MRQRRMKSAWTRLVFAAGVLVVMALLAAPAFARKDKEPPAQVPEGQLGSMKVPVKCDQDLGEYEYLTRLRGPDGKRVKYEYVTSVNGGPHGTALDKYLVKSKDGSIKIEIYMSRHYPGYIENRPIEGFTMKK